MILTILALLTAETDPMVNCDFQYNFDETVACERAEYQRAETELEQQWQSALAAAQRYDREYGGADPQKPSESLVDTLHTAQHAWATYRDAHCQIVRREHMPDSVLQLNRVLCLRQLTTTRSRELERRTMQILNDE